MNKKYILLLSLFIGCISKAMDEASNELLRTFCWTPEQQFQLTGDIALKPAVATLQQEIENDIKTLREYKMLDAETVTKSITNQLLLYAEKHKMPENTSQALKREYEDIYRNILPCVLQGKDITRFDVDNRGVQIAIMEQENYGRSTVAGLAIWKEELPQRTWQKTSTFTLNNPAGSRIRYMRWVHNDTKLLFWIKDRNWNNCYLSFDCVSNTQDNQASQADIQELDELHLKASKEKKDNSDWRYLKDGRIATHETSDKKIMLRSAGIAVLYKPTVTDIADYLITKQ